MHTDGFEVCRGGRRGGEKGKIKQNNERKQRSDTIWSRMDHVPAVWTLLRGFKGKAKEGGMDGVKEGWRGVAQQFCQAFRGRQKKREKEGEKRGGGGKKGGREE